MMLFATTASAQSVRLSAGAMLPISGEIDPAWSVQPGASGQILLPMYGGETRLSLDIAAHDATRETVPDFTALNAALGWGPVFGLGPVRVVPSAEVGANRLFFDDDGVFGENLSAETELTAGTVLRASVPLAGPAEVWTEAGVRRTFFSTTVTTATVSAGLAVRL
ncbi:MAG: hypothetical protein AAGI52_11860 [Bacteroidota bacterium]